MSKIKEGVGISQVERPKSLPMGEETHNHHVLQLAVSFEPRKGRSNDLGTCYQQTPRSQSLEIWNALESPR